MALSWRGALYCVCLALVGRIVASFVLQEAHDLDTTDHSDDDAAFVQVSHDVQTRRRANGAQNSGADAPSSSSSQNDAQAESPFGAPHGPPQKDFGGYVSEHAELRRVPTEPLVGTGNFQSRRSKESDTPDAGSRFTQREMDTSLMDETQIPNNCGFNVHPGLITVIHNPLTDALAFDLTDALAQSSSGRISLMITAMDASGAYLDQGGFATTFASPRETYVSTVFDFEPEGTSQVKVFKPIMDIRTSDNQSADAVQKGIGSGWTDMRPRLVTPLCSVPSSLEASLGFSPSVIGANRVIIDAFQFISNGFYVVGPMSSIATTYDLSGIQAYQTNLAVTSEYLCVDTVPDSPWKIGFSMTLLPDQPMQPRPSDDRLLYFTTDYTDKGYRLDGPQELPSKAVDRTVQMIWRYNLTRQPENQIRIHVDPSVPMRWRPYFKSGIEAWNDGFAMIGLPGTVKAVLPNTSLWPDDYNVADARFSTINWVLTPQVVSMGIAKVDPRSGEIVKSDITMSDGWVRAWLNDLDVMLPNYTHSMLLSENVARKYSRAKRNTSADKGEAQPHSLASFSLMRHGLNNSLTPAQLEDLIGQGLRDIVMHEVGHVLGLRHNFKGSMGVSYACTIDPACSAVQGLTASVMDYIDINWGALSDPNAHAFTPVIGGYDKLAIMYGYMNASEASWSQPAPELQAVLQQAEAYQTCYDDDQSLQDPSCETYDWSGDPLYAHDQMLGLIATAQANLLTMAVGPGDRMSQYGEAAHLLLSKALTIGQDSMKWIGGINNTYVHRGNEGVGIGQPARAPMPASEQRHAMNISVRLFRPHELGLVPPAANWQYLVTTDVDFDHVTSYDLGQKVRLLISIMMESLLSSSRISQLYLSENLLNSSVANDTYTVSEYLHALVSEVFKHGIETTDDTEWHIQTEYVDRLIALYLNSASGSSTLPPAVRTQLLYYVQVVNAATHGALQQLPPQVSLAANGSMLSNPSSNELLRSQLNVLKSKFQQVLCNPGSDCDSPKVFAELPAAAPSGSAPRPAMSALFILLISFVAAA